MSTPVEAFWEVARFHARLNSVPSYFGPTTLEVVPPPAWSFGDGPEESDALLRLVLDGTKTATATALSDYDAGGQPLPERGTMSILLDGAGHPRALIEATEVTVAPFEDVTEEHAFLEGEGDRSLAGWRAQHERLFRGTAPDDAGFTPGMPVVLERFRVVYQAP